MTAAAGRRKTLMYDKTLIGDFTPSTVSFYGRDRYYAVMAVNRAIKSM